MLGGEFLGIPIALWAFGALAIFVGVVMALPSRWSGEESDWLGDDDG